MFDIFLVILSIYKKRNVLEYRYIVRELRPGDILL